MNLPIRSAAIDPLALRDLAPLWDLIHDPSVEIVMHAAGEDLRIFLLRTGALPNRVFDVQIAALCRTRGATLATRNAKDFEETGIDVINPSRQS